MKINQKVTNFLSLILGIWLYLIPFTLPKSTSAADFIQDDSGIQTMYRDYVPHLSTGGQLRNVYGADSMFVKGIYDVDLTNDLVGNFGK